MKIATVHEDSEPWVFDTVSGKPRKGEFTDNPIKKTCYYLDLEVKD